MPSYRRASSGRTAESGIAVNRETLVVILLGVALAAALFIYSLLSLLKVRQISVRERMDAIREQSLDYSEVQSDVPLIKRTQKQILFQSLGALSARLRIGEKTKDKQRQTLQRAGILMKPEELSGLKIVFMIVLGVVAVLVTRQLPLAILGAILGLILPDVFIHMKLKRRAKKLNDQLPEALTVTANGIRAGFSFTQAIGMVVREMEDPIAGEFSRMLRENAFGKPMEEALMNLSERTHDEDLDIVITALLIQRQVGGSLAEILDTIAETIRERVKLKGDIRTMTAQGKLSAVIVSIMPFAMAAVLNLINPGYMAIMFESPIGALLLVLAVVFVAIGIFILTRIIQIKV